MVLYIITNIKIQIIDISSIICIIHFMGGISMIADLNVYRNNQFEPVEFSIDPSKILLSAWKKKM